MSTQFKSETFTNGAIVEVGTVTHDGVEFAALGSIVDEARGVIVGYPKGDKLQSWNGKDIPGVVLRVTSSWPVQSYIGSRMYAYSATYKGRRYHGRGFGEGMSLNLRANKTA